jgi:hypothetical protein
MSKRRVSLIAGTVVALVGLVLLVRPGSRGSNGEAIVAGVPDSVAEAIGNLGDVLGGSDAADVDAGHIELPEIGLEHELEGPSPFSLRTVAMLAVGF